MIKKLKPRPVAVVVDDSVDLGTSFERALNLCNFDTEYVSDSRQAMNRIRSRRPNVVMLDMDMPYVTGKDILEAIRADANLGNTKVIMVTANERAAQHEIIYELSDLVLLKPVTLDQIVAFASRLA